MYGITPGSRVYIAGPMTGIEDYNYPAFHAEEDRLRALGFVALNPARSFGGDTSRPRCEYLRAAVENVFGADALSLLPGWQMSPGAVLEVAIAHELEIPCYQGDALVTRGTVRIFAVVSPDLLPPVPGDILLAVVRD